MSAALHTVSGLLSEINELQNMVLYYENRILRKRIAISEIFAGSECREDELVEGVPSCAPSGAPEAPSDDFPIRNFKFRSGPSMPQMITSILPEMNGAPFDSGDLKKACLEKYPEMGLKIHANIYNCTRLLVARGTLVRVPGGLRPKP